MQNTTEISIPLKEWERGQLLERDPEEHLQVCIVNCTYNGIDYQGSGYYYDGELEKVEDIEVV